jgi:hypothetical protein
LLLVSIVVGNGVVIPSGSKEVTNKKVVSTKNSAPSPDSKVPQSDRPEPPSSPDVMSSSKNQKEKEMLYEAYNMLHTLAQVSCAEIC